MASEYVQKLTAARQRAVEERRNLVDAISKAPKTAEPGELFQKYRAWFMSTQELIETIDQALDDEESHSD